MTKEIDHLERLLKENLRLNRKVLELTEKTQKYIYWMRILNFLKVSLILIPILLAVLYLPPFFKQIYLSYQEVYQQIDNLRKGNIDQIDPSSLNQLLP